MKTKLCVVALAALVIWGLKRHYAEAGADDLSWILSPTARLVSVATGTSFVAVPAEGYISYERRFVIEKSCAGINFMVAAFAMAVVALFHRVGSTRSGVGVLMTGLLAAYGSAVLVNATRITIALWLADRPLQSTFTAAQVHRVEGIAVYFGGLVLLYELIQRIERRVLLTGSR